MNDQRRQRGEEHAHHERLNIDVQHCVSSELRVKGRSTRDVERILPCPSPPAKWAARSRYTF
eukprot:6515058-Prymnesium_polylepis.1